MPIRPIEKNAPLHQRPPETPSQDEYDFGRWFSKANSNANHDAPEEKRNFYIPPRLSAEDVLILAQEQQWPLESQPINNIDVYLANKPDMSVEDQYAFDFLQKYIGSTH